MRSSNPVFSRRGSFRDGGYGGSGMPQAGPAQAGNPYAQGSPYAAGNPYAATHELDEPVRIGRPPGPPQAGRMTMDDVVVRTAAVLGVVVLGAAVGWFTVPVGNFGYPIAVSLLAVGVYFAVFLRRRISPPLMFAYAVLQGFAVGAWSHTFDYLWNGVVAQAVLGTMAVFGGTLVAYKVGAVRVTPRYARVGIAIAIGFVVLTLVNLFAALIGGGDGLGLRTGALGVLVGVVGVLLGAFFLTLDFNEVERGIRNGAPRDESWLAAFGLTVSLVWIYMELLRLLAIFRE